MCLTCGSEGVHYKAASGNWQHMPAQPVTVKNATGAGDAFWAGFISAWNVKQTLDDCVHHGIEIASRKLSGDL
ncbi:PfkB family carbohydrate kinase [Filimonas effusa]|uniref:PfkB family carbohydrate kinase n=1 Tax=Filimonas effusa TaxID=2508721 RepID=UPI002483109F|nr:PfkB family carbohydrate kinase [Filimonas effusa]